MPHTNRKKKTVNVLHTKRTQVEDSDGWTHVVPATKAQRPANLNDTAMSDSYNTDFATMSYEEIQAEHERARRQWEASEDNSKLKSILAGYGETHNITSVICLGLGSPQDLSSRRRRTSHAQLLALQTITSALGLGSVRHIAQEPRFTNLDKQFLVSQGFEVLENPEAFKHIDGQSLVYAMHCEFETYQQVGRQPPCAILIGNEIEEYIENHRHIPDTTDLENLIKNCDAVDFPGISNDFIFTKIYRRQPVSEAT